MKNWKAVLAVLGGIAATIIISGFGATSAGTRSYSPELMAAWVQATGAIGAILASGWLVKWQFDKQRALQIADQQESLRIRAMHLIAIANEALTTVNLMVSSFSSDEDADRFLKGEHDPNRIEVIGLALREIPVLELPSTELVLPVIMLRSACERISDASRALSEMKVQYLGQHYPERVNTLEHKVLVEQAGYVDNARDQIVTYVRHRNLI
ncbi:hypothetical protein [Burkholderia sp. 572]|uniref:hypothetical protein n=1 Tax=Burkholderia sp. 572 TaxID=3156414 RepID=UPI003392C52C